MDSEKCVGLDVHQATTVVAVTDSTGKLVMESILETEAATLLQFLEAENSYTLTMAPVGRSVADTMWEGSSWPDQFSLRRLSVATLGIKSMFLRRARATRLAAGYLLFTVALLMVPKADIPETPFDEGSTQINEMVVVKAASSLAHRQSVTVSVPIRFAQSRKISVCRISPVYTGQSTDSCRFQELFCSLLC